MHIIAEHSSDVNRGKPQKQLKNDMRNHAVLDVLQSDLFLHTAREPYYEDPGDAEEHYLPHSVASENERDKKKYWQDEQRHSVEIVLRHTPDGIENDDEQCEYRAGYHKRKRRHDTAQL